MIFANLRICFLNWLAKPSKTTFINAYKKEKEMPYATFNNNSAGAYTLGGGGITLSNPVGQSLPLPPIDLKDGINFTLAQASGGWIIQINKRYTTSTDLYIIPEEKDLGIELGKIITMSCLKG
jgi:hypothetical protein